MIINHWHQIEPGLFSAGQPLAQEWAEIAAKGITTVINLRPENEQSEVDEEKLVAAHEMNYIQLPIASTDDLTPENVRLFATLVDQYRGGGLLVHCGSGNRVGAMFALSQFRKSDMSIEQAIKYGHKAGLTGLEQEVIEILSREII
jgi:uncharacterized protein (TIGR01244 family)